jgi:SPP1 gp7 family putative phage head morphogenesis protein
MTITALGRLDDILMRAVRRSVPASVSICTEIRRHVDRSRSLAAARERFVPIARQLDAFGLVFADEGLVSDLFGRLEVLVHDGGISLQAPALEFSQASAQEAVDWFSRHRLMKQERLGWLRTAYRRKGRVIGRDLQAYVQQRLDDSLVKAIHLGQTKREWLAEAGQTFDAWGLTRPARHHLETVFDTTGLAAYNHGRFQQQRDPAMMKARPIWQYKTAGDANVRPTHAQMENFTAPADDLIWNSWYPPNGFRCRCAVISLIDGDLSPAVPEGLVPDRGFATSPADWLL